MAARLAPWFAVCLAFGSPHAGAQADTGDSLLQQHRELQEALAKSPFGRPLVLRSGTSASQPQGEVFAIVAHPFRNVAAALQRGEQWCDLLMLQSNVKRCLASGRLPQQLLRVAVGRKFDQPIENAFEVEFRYKLRSAQADYLAVQMLADAGPMGTADYRLAMEAVPLGADRTFVHMSYSYSAGMAARLATSAYLATAGRDKVGFSVVGRDDTGKPRYVDGVRGVAERNTMRYYLAIESVLDTAALPPAQQTDARLRDWFEATERYPRQLKEMERDEYLAMKQRELRAQRVAGG